MGLYISDKNARTWVHAIALVLAMPLPRSTPTSSDVGCLARGTRVSTSAHWFRVWTTTLATISCYCWCEPRWHCMSPEPEIRSDCPFLCPHRRISSCQCLPITSDINMCSIFFEWRYPFSWLRIILNVTQFTSPETQTGSSKMDVDGEGRFPIVSQGKDQGVTGRNQLKVSLWPGTEVGYSSPFQNWGCTIYLKQRKLGCETGPAAETSECMERCIGSKYLVASGR